jgi:hypothetical protein
MSPFFKNTFWPSLTSSPVNTTFPAGSTTFSGIGGWPL